MALGAEVKPDDLVELSRAMPIMRQRMKIHLGLLSLILSVGPCLGEGEHRIQMDRPAVVGQRYQLSSRAQQTIRNTTSAGQQSLPEQKVEMAAELESVVEVLEIDSRGKTSKAAYTVKKCNRIQGKEKTQLFPPETVLTAAVQDGKVHFSVNSKPVEADSSLLLSIVVDVSVDDVSNDDILGSKTPRKIGGSWKITPGPLVSVFKKQNVKVDPEDIQGQATLEDVVKVGDIDCLEITSKIFIKKFSPPLPPGLQIKQEFGSLRFSGRFPVDPSLGSLEESLTMSMDISAQGKPSANLPSATVKISSTLSRTLKRNYLK